MESLIPPGGGQKQNDDGIVQPQEEKKEEEISGSQIVPSSEAQGGAMVFTEKEKHFERKQPDFLQQNSRLRASASDGQAIFQIEVEKIKPNPHQPRKNFGEDSLRELAASIREVGILQPIVVTKVEKETSTGTDVEYILIAGERRFLAAKILGLERVPAIVRRVDFERERLEMAIIENLQRENLNPVETARAFSRLQDEFNLTQREIATRLGKSREAVANSVRLLDLPAYIQDSLAKGELSETHGRLLLSVADPASQKKLFDDIVLNKMTTRELKDRVRPDKKESSVQSLSPELVMLEHELTSKFKAPVKIEKHGPPAGGGKITIRYYSDEELRGILEQLKLE